MATWHLAPSLVQLRDEIDSTWPNRPKGSDGTIGDQAHAARKSEHNPDNDPDPMPRGAVSAMDITKMSAAGMERIRKALIADERTWYVIHNGFIWSRTNGFSKAIYHGDNQHPGHLHVSLMQTRAAHDSTAPWGIAKVEPQTEPKSAPDKSIGDAVSRPQALPVLKRGSTGEMVATLQRFLGVRPDAGKFGPRTARAVRRYQREQGLVADGVVGPNTWARITTKLKIPGYNA